MTRARARHAPSIVRRLSRSVLLIVLVGSLIGAAAAAVAVSAVVKSLMDSAMEEAAQVLVVLAEHEEDVEALGHGRVLPAAPHREVLVWQLRDSSGSLVARSHEAPAQPWNVPLFEGHQQADGLAVFTVAGRKLWLQVAQPLDGLHSAQRTAALRVGGAVLGLGLVVAAFVAWHIRSELRPVQQMARDVASINPGPTSAPLPRSPRLELEPVYAALDALLDRLSLKLRSEQAFASHAAHSLRTPLAGLSAQLEVSKLQAPPELRQRLDLAIDAARRLNGVVGGLLAMAHTTEPFAWVRFEARELGRVALGGRIAADVSALDGVPPMHGNLDLLTAAVANLVDNAARHGASQVVLCADVSPHTQRVRVLDNGPGVPAERLQELRHALARFNAAGEISSVVGLGLTLAAAVARTHGGHVDLDCMHGTDSGFCVELSWPPSPPRGGSMDKPPQAPPRHEASGRYGRTEERARL